MRILGNVLGMFPGLLCRYIKCFSWLNGKTDMKIPSNKKWHNVLSPHNLISNAKCYNE